MAAERPPFPVRECKRGHYHEPTEEYWRWNKNKSCKAGGLWRCRECGREAMRAYNQKPERKARMRAYGQTPERKARKRACWKAYRASVAGAMAAIRATNNRRLRRIDEQIAELEASVA